MKIVGKLKEQKNQHILYQPVIKSLAEFASRADQETVKKILNLLQSLVDALNESKTLEEVTEAQRAEDWEALSKDLLNERQTLTQRKVSEEESIESYQGIIKDPEEKITQHANELENNRNLLEQQESWCEEVAKSYQSNTLER